jgi:membrane protease YdiL (CAAX protease family)
MEMENNKIISILANAPLITLFVLLLTQSNKNIEFSFILLRFCIREELVFRYIPFHFLEKTVESCVSLGFAYGFYHYCFFDTTFTLTIVYFFIGFVYALSSLRYRFIEIVQIRYLLLTILLKDSIKID